ncbi:MAG: efflux RND transporter permease subunit [Bradymonadia bacterium]
MSDSSGKPVSLSKLKQNGTVAWMAKNSVASNVLMAILLVGGAIMATTIQQEVFPEVETDKIVVDVPYPGASPAEVEQGIALVVEESIRGVDGVKRVISQSNEGMGNVTAELLEGSDTDRALSDIKGAVDRIVTFPRDAEQPQVYAVISRRQVVSLILYGQASEEVLRQTAERIREELLRLKDITLVELSGVKSREIGIEVPQENLRAYGLTLEQVSQAVQQASVELPGGSLKTEAGEFLIRTTERRDLGREFADIIVLSRPDGTQVRLGNVAIVKDGFAETDQESTFDGNPAVRIDVYRVGDQTPIEVSDAVKGYIAQTSKSLPPGLAMATWDDQSEIFADRIDLLTRNAKLGLLLVFVVLGLFLEIRLAFWVMLGIPISFLGAFLLMPLFGVSINMISLFAFIVVLGIVVDDAIVVGENVYEMRNRGMKPMEAAIEGAKRVSMPVVFAVLTTVAAFAPMLFVPGFMGKLFWVVPSVVIPVLILSLVESLYVLPAHLAHLKKEPGRVFKVINRYQGKISGALEWFIHRLYRPVVRTAVRWRYLTIATAFGMMMLTVGFIQGGFVKFVFFPSVESEIVWVDAKLPVGANIEETKKLRDRLTEALIKVLEDKGGRDTLSRGIYSTAGSAVAGMGPTGPMVAIGSHMSNVTIFMVPSDDRKLSAQQLAAAWRETLGEVPGIDTLKFTYSLAPGSGAAIDVELSHRDVETLERAAAMLAERLRRFSGVTDIDSGFSNGKSQIDIELKPEGRALGITEAYLARQLRSAFYGAEALRQQRGRDEVRVMVRLPKHDRVSLAGLESLIIRTPAGGEVPLGQAATLKLGKAYTRIKRVDGRRALNVTAEVEEGKANANEIVAKVKATILPELVEEVPGLTYGFEGQQREQAESGKSLAIGFMGALIAIWALLAVPLRRYTQPFVIMSVIPFGFIGAVIGHAVLGYNLSMISIMGVIALAGVVVNDSLVLVVAVNEMRDEGVKAFDAAVAGGVRRFRPILLTSLTTFFGLMPMIFETSMQAKFLIPMAVSLGFGVLFATFIVLLLVPSLYMIFEDIYSVIRWLRGKQDSVIDHDFDTSHTTEEPAKTSEVLSHPIG